AHVDNVNGVAEAFAVQIRTTDGFNGLRFHRRADFLTLESVRRSLSKDIPMPENHTARERPSWRPGHCIERSAIPEMRQQPPRMRNTIATARGPNQKAR